MKRFLIVALCVVFARHSIAQEMDKELTQVASRLATLTSENGKKKVTVLDFTDLDGRSSELGKYVAEQLTVNMVIVKSNFSLVDRQNLKKILAEHKLTETGLIDPENAKKLGKFAGVDALILGNVVKKNARTISLTAKIITTDTAEIVGAAKADFNIDDNVKELVEKPQPPPEISPEDKAKAAALQDDKAKVVKAFGDLRVEVQSLKIVNGKDYFLTMMLTNMSPKKSAWVALNFTSGYNPKALLRDSDEHEFQTSQGGVSGIAHVAYVSYPDTGMGFYNATELKPKESAIATIKLFSPSRKTATAGKCTLLLEVLTGNEYQNGFGKCTLNSIVAKIEAD